MARTEDSVRSLLHQVAPDVTGVDFDLLAERVNRRRLVTAATAGLTCAVVAAGILVAVLFATNHAGGDGKVATLHQVDTSPTGIVNDFIPGANVVLATLPSTANGERQQLRITAPVTTIPPGLTPLQHSFAVNELGWRAQISASLVALRQLHLYNWTLNTGQGASQSPSDGPHGGVGPFSGPQKQLLDSIPSSEAINQLRSNLSVLTSTLPKGTIVGDTIKTYSVGGTFQQYALEVTITVAHASSLHGHYGDTIEGLQTGLTGSVSTSLIEGLAIVVKTQNGTPIVQALGAVRDQSGSIQFANPAAETQSQTPTAKYPNLTGGPNTTSGVGLDLQQVGS